MCSSILPLLLGKIQMMVTDIVNGDDDRDNENGDNLWMYKHYRMNDG